MQEKSSNREYVVTNFELSPKVRRPSQSMQNIFKKTPAYENSFLKIRDVSLTASVIFNKITDEPEVCVFFPVEIHEGIKTGKIPFDRVEFSRVCEEIANKAKHHRELEKNPTRVYHKT